MKYVKKNKCGKEIHSYSCTTIDFFFQISDYLHIVALNPSINFHPIYFKTFNHVINFFVITHLFLEIVARRQRRQGKGIGGIQREIET